MNLRTYILFYLLTLLIPVSDTLAQNLPVACVNSKVRYKVKPLPGSTIIWTVNGGTVIKDYNDSIDIQWGNSNSGTPFLRYKEKTTYGCESPDETDYVQLNSPFIDLGSIKQLCEGQDTLLDASGSFAKYEWSTTSTAPSIRVSKAGVYKVKVTDSVGCTYIDSVIVAVNAAPIINLAQNITVCAPETYTFIPHSSSAVRYFWFGINESPTYVAQEGENLIWVKGLDAYGCAGYDSTTLLDCSIGDKIPNAFTPSGDPSSENEVWRIDEKIRIKYPNMVVKIYDRWGRLVFVSDRGYGSPWDGTSKGKILPMDTYYYVINFGNGDKDLVGSVAIIR